LATLTGDNIFISCNFLSNLITSPHVPIMPKVIKKNITKEKTCWSSGRVGGVGVMTLDVYD